MKCRYAVMAGLLFAFNAAYSQEAKTPPTGWKEFTPPSNGYTVWVPEKVKRQMRESTRSVLVPVRRGKVVTRTIQKLKIGLLNLELGPDLTYQVEVLTLPPALRLPPKDLEETLKDSVISSLRGKQLAESDVKAGEVSGKEYQVQTGNGLARVRIFAASAGRVFVVHVEGSKEQVEKEDTLTFLKSFNIPTNPPPPVVAKPADPANPTTGGAANSKDLKLENENIVVDGSGLTSTGIKGFDIGNEFRDTAKAGYLVGFEVGLAKFVNDDVIHSFKPIYRDGDKETEGTLWGPPKLKLTKVVAKPGYVVASITVKTGLTVDGMSATFMKLKDGKLDPSDSYESDWVGGMGGAPKTKIGSESAPVIGIIGKINDQKQACAIGLLMKPAK